MDKQLIVCADDFGLTRGVNKGIFDCYNKGIVKSASLMAAGRELDHAIDLSKSTSGLDLGIHLCLTDLAPVCPDLTRVLLDGNGKFCTSYLKIIKTITVIPKVLNQIEAEFRCQIECLLNKDITLSHINSHKHIHIYPPIWKIVAELADEYKIPYIRYPVEEFARLGEIFLHKGKEKNYNELFFFFAFFLFFNKRFHNSKINSKKFIKSPDFFCGLYDTGFLDEFNIVDLIRKLHPGVTELMCHPGYIDDELLQLPTRLTHSREKEVEVLCSHSVKKMLQDNNINLTSFSG